jgi:predicted nucleic acid-binding protein
MYLDSAIVVKLLVRESDSDWFDRRLRGESFESSELALTEVQSALLAKERAGSISSFERVAAMEKFRGMIDDEVITLFKLNHMVLERAVAILIACHPGISLRTLDALHVATADLHNCPNLSTTDNRMRSACERFAITLVPGTIEELSKT